jgi:type I restriction enzyme R subunit
LKDQCWDPETNLFTDILRAALVRINPEAAPEEIERVRSELPLLLDYEDLGKAFHERLLRTDGIRLIDFDHFDNNSFHIVTELTCRNGEDEFRPDITLLLNGMPLFFMEVKKPNNRDGILAERNRIQRRFRNPKFRRFINLTQLMVFSNNMEYADDSPEPLEGAFYATTARDTPAFNCFREEEKRDLSEILAPLDPRAEALVLADNNLPTLRHTPEYAVNLAPDTPTNRLSTALFSRDRLAFLLRYAFAYVRGTDGLQKHVMRYPQIFAIKAIRRMLEEGIRRGIIWHTQGSGKTALAFYSVRFLTDWFRERGTVPKFYFIVDRLDLLTQAAKEFRGRGLVVHEISSRDEFARDIRSPLAVHNHAGSLEITVVNIQKFKDDPDVIHARDYDLRLQRVYFLDEVHRSYNPQGSFLANLNESDPNAIKIGLTGTPLLGDYPSRALFGGYIHKYYYNSSIADGYTLRLIREGISTNYRMQLQQALEDIRVLRGESRREEIFAHERFVEPMLDYIVSDLGTARATLGDSTIGGMVICDSAAQARKMAEIFAEKYAPPVTSIADAPRAYLTAAEEPPPFRFTPRPEYSVRSCALILHDEGDKQFRKETVDEFKDGKIDLLFVYNMLLTGFDAPRLKKLYLGREIKHHNLLQALTRVNRTYGRHRYGYVVDFVDIRRQFDLTNQAYLRELNEELGDEAEHYSHLFKSPEDILADIEGIKDALFHFDTTNAEIFSQQISQITDRAALRELVRALDDARGLYNLIRLTGQYQLLEELDFRKLAHLSTEANHRLALLNQREALESGHAETGLLNIALEEVLFTFRKVSESELRIADELRDILLRTREGLAGNFDPRDPEFVSLREELERLFRSRNLSEITTEEMQANIAALNDIHARARELERKNQLLRAKYANDAKYARLHKRLLEKGEPAASERKLFEALASLKAEADARISQNGQLLTNPAFAAQMMTTLIIEQFRTRHQLPLTPESCQFISALVVREYLDEFNGASPA